MSHNSKKVLAVGLILIIIAGWYATLFGIGGVAPIKERMKLGLDIKGGVYVVMEAQTDAKDKELRDLMEQTQVVIENRVNQLGVSEPVVTIEGTKKIRVEMPGLANSKEAIDAIGKTAQLKFALSDGTVILDGSQVKSATAVTDQEHGGYAIALEFNSQGADIFADATARASRGEITSTTPGVLNNAIAIILDDEVISAPIVTEAITGGKCEISSSNIGGYPHTEASQMAALIRGGALPVALEEVNSGEQTAKIGETALNDSIIAGAIGLGLIFVIMVVAYNIMGIAANIALLLYVLLILWPMIAMGAVLTLPGIAGIILSVGMAVDANVVIFSRIKEEIHNGKTLRVAVQTGFKRALNTVLDSQLTTLIAAVVLYQVGTSSVKGFAITLIIGILASLVTATVVTQLFVGIMAESRLVGNKRYFGFRSDGTPTFMWKKNVDFMKFRKIYYIIAVVLITVGLLIAGIGGMNYGIDFTGGTMMQLDFKEKISEQQINDVLEENGVNDAEIIFASDDQSEVIIRTTVALENNERADLINNIQNKIGNAEVAASELFGPSVGKELRSNAILAIIIAAIGMLIYIIIRFEWKFGIASIAGIAHDVLLVVAFYGIFQVTVNNPFIAGILTVVGYSINDTIVVFDRIRENLGLMPKAKTEELVNKSINQTLVRSLMTSITTLIVMIPLFLMTGSAIRSFVIPLMIGITVGMISSITVASPIYCELCKVTGGSRYKGKKRRKIKQES
ncbi:MAG: protein translocase subunit SecD [Eubacteriales bacterium]|nr:protein translocase subunit SecD [Eubacteriales bacterium]MDD4389483.1 protein translocase subunit SecD [Eubacteriales bacterium]